MCVAPRQLMKQVRKWQLTHTHSKKKKKRRRRRGESDPSNCSMVTAKREGLARPGRVQMEESP